MAFRRVAVGISGGVDSAVCAHLLKQQGFQVVGLFMRNWDLADETGHCQSEKDWEDAQFVCDKLKIPLQQVNFVKQYWNEVFGHFLRDYESGITPNPDILCNRYIKFNYCFRHAIDHMKADAFATGHYARTSFGPYLEHFRPDQKVLLLESVDDFKDQTFFLSQVNQEALRRTMFPVGELRKDRVKVIADEIGLQRILAKRESVGICFIGQRNFPNFINEYIKEKPGDFIDFDTGEKVGTHLGLHNWTIGQRCNLGGFPKPYFVQRKEVKDNRIYVVQGTDHPALFTDFLFTGEPHWIAGSPGDIFEGQFRFQHTKPLVDCVVFQLSPDSLLVHLKTPLRALTPGQYAVFYKEKTCIGSARITHPGPVLFFSQNKNI